MDGIYSTEEHDKYNTTSAKDEKMNRQEVMTATPAEEDEQPKKQRRKAPVFTEAHLLGEGGFDKLFKDTQQWTCTNGNEVTAHLLYSTRMRVLTYVWTHGIVSVRVL
jgi:hypothetical protein